MVFKALFLRVSRLHGCQQHLGYLSQMNSAQTTTSTSSKPDRSFFISENLVHFNTSYTYYSKEVTVWTLAAQETEPHSLGTFKHFLLRGWKSVVNLPNVWQLTLSDSGLTLL